MDLSYIFTRSDAVLTGVFSALLLMSVASWYFIITRGVRMWRQNRASDRFLQRFWDSSNWEEAHKLACSHDIPLAGIAIAGINAMNRYRDQAHSKLGESCGLDEFLVRAIRNGLSQQSAKLETGLSVLASAGSTSPFIGLFGTVWGIYHALANIAAKGNATLEAVAGPMGEALVATAAGLAVAIPAVLAYNALVRGNRILQSEMDAFAHDLHAQLIMAPASPSEAESANQAARKSPQLARV